MGKSLKECRAELATCLPGDPRKSSLEKEIERIETWMKSNGYKIFKPSASSSTPYKSGTKYQSNQKMFCPHCGRPTIIHPTDNSRCSGCYGDCI